MNIMIPKQKEVFFFIVITMQCFFFLPSFANADTNKFDVALVHIKQYEMAIQKYKEYKKVYPKSLEQLLSFEPGKEGEINTEYFLKRPTIIEDPWGNNYSYSYPAKYGHLEFDLYSYGKNLVDDHGESDDITNWKEVSPDYYKSGISSENVIFFTLLALVIIASLFYVVGKK